MEKPLMISMSRRLWPFVMAFTGRSGSISARSPTTGTISRGKSPSRKLWKALLGAAEMSRRMRASSLASSRAGLQSMTAV